MRIFLVLNPSGNRSVPGSNTWLRNIYEPLIDIGHEVFFINTADAEKKLGIKRNTSRYLEIFSSYILETFRQEDNKRKFDIFFSYVTDDQIDAGVLDIIKKSGTMTLNFSCNNTHQFSLTQKIAPHFDFNLHSEKDADIKFRGVNARPIWFPMAANPAYYHPVKADKLYDVSFIGSNYAKRSLYIRHLLVNGVDVNCFGPNWLINRPHPKLKLLVKEGRRTADLIKAILTVSASKRVVYTARVSLYDFNKNLRNEYIGHFHYPVSDEKMITLYSQSLISLGFLEVMDNNDQEKIVKQHLHLREFEAPMCGALYFTNYCSELEEFYEPDREIVVFRNEHELLDKAKYYLNHPSEAESVRVAGHNRANNCHSYQARFKKLFSQINK